MRNVRDYVLSNGLFYKVISVEEVERDELKTGVVDRILKNKPKHDGGDSIKYKNYHVTVKGERDTANRIFIYNERQATGQEFEFTYEESLFI